MRGKNFIISGLLIVVTCLSTVLSTAAGLDQRFLKAQQDNAAALRKYKWKSRTEIQRDGETKNVQVSLLAYDENGALHKSPISSSPQPDLPTHGLRGLIAQKKKKEFTNELDGLGTLARSYGELQPETLRTFMATANITPERQGNQQLIRISGHNVLQRGDSLSLWLDPATQKQRRVVVDTFMNNDPVRIVSEYEDLPHGGPTFNVRSQVNYNGTAIVIITQNFDYTLVRPRIEEKISLTSNQSEWRGLTVSLLRFTGALLYIQAAPAVAAAVIGAGQQV